MYCTYILETTRRQSLGTNPISQNHAMSTKSNNTCDRAQASRAASCTRRCRPRAARTAALGAREPLQHAHVGPPPSPARRLRRRPEPGPPQAQGAPPHLREADTLPLSKTVLGRAVTAVVCGRAPWRLTNPSRPRGGGWRAGRCVASAAPAGHRDHREACATPWSRVHSTAFGMAAWDAPWPHHRGPPTRAPSPERLAGRPEVDRQRPPTAPERRRRSWPSAPEWRDFMRDHTIGR